MQQMVLLPIQSLQHESTSLSGTTLFYHWLQAFPKSQTGNGFIFSQVTLEIHSGKQMPLHSNYLSQTRPVTFVTTWNVVIPFTAVTA